MRRLISAVNFIAFKVRGMAAQQVEMLPLLSDVLNTYRSCMTIPLLLQGDIHQHEIAVVCAVSYIVGT